MGKRKVEKKMKRQQRRAALEEKKKNRRLIGWTLAIVLVVCLSVIVFHQSSSTQVVAPENMSVFQLQKQPMMGVNNAPVKIVEFADFKCPACQRFDQTIIPQLKKEFVDTGVVDVYFINDPIISPDTDSKTAALAGEAVYHQDPQEFWKFYEAVYANQEDERMNWATSDRLVEIAKQAKLNLDFTKLKKDIDAAANAQDVQDDEAIANKVGADSTPTVYINGSVLSAQDTFDYAAIKHAILNARGGSGK